MDAYGYIWIHMDTYDEYLTWIHKGAQEPGPGPKLAAGPWARVYFLYSYVSMCIHMYPFFFCPYRLPMIIGIDESWMGRAASPLVDAGKFALTISKAHNDAIQGNASTKVLRTDCNPLVPPRSTTGMPAIGVSNEMRESPKKQEQVATFAYAIFMVSVSVSCCSWGMKPYRLM